MGNSPSQILASSDGSTDDDHAHQLVLQAEQLAQDALEGFYAKKLKIASTPSSSYPPQKILSHVNYVRTIPCLATFVQDERTIEEGIKVAVSSYVGQEGVRTSSIQNGLEAITRSAVGSLLREASPGRKLTKEKYAILTSSATDPDFVSGSSAIRRLDMLFFVYKFSTAESSAVTRNKCEAIVAACVVQSLVAKMEFGADKQ